MPEVELTLERISRMAADLGFHHLEPQLAACRRLAQSRQGMDVAVFGRFKAGKSSLLNHLTGRPVLPIGVVPLTAVITRLRYGEEERAEVHFRDGRMMVISPEEIRQFVGEQENPNNTKRVALVEVFLPVLGALAPLQLVDTPGLGSAFLHNTQAALEWLPNVAAALVAISADAPLSERDLALLEQLRAHTPKMALLLTKADLLDEGQRLEVLAFVREQMRRLRGEELPVFFYSIHPAHAALKAQFLEQFLVPLREGCATAAQEILHHKVALVQRQVRDYLQASIAAASQAEAARESLRAHLEEERRQWALTGEELEALAYQWRATALEHYLAALQPVCGRLQEKVAAELAGQFPRWRGRLPRLMRVWREWLHGFLARELPQVSAQYEPVFYQPLHKTGAHLGRVVRAFQDRLAVHVHKALGVALTPHDFTPMLQEPPAPPLEVGYGFDVTLDMAGHLVPMCLFRAAVERALTRKAQWEVEKNLSRLAAAWQDLVGAAIMEVTRQAQQQMLRDWEILETLLSRTSSDVPRLRQALEALEEGAKAGEVLEATRQLHPAGAS